MEIKLRNWEIEDAQLVVKYANNKNVSKYLRDVFPFPYTLDDAKSYIRYCSGADKSKNILFAIDIEGKAVGAIGLTIQNDVNRKCAELGFWLGESFWNNGVMTRAVKEMCQMGFRLYDIERIYAEVFDDNTASKSVLEKCGFTMDGVMRNSIFKDGKLQNACIYSILKKEID